MPPKRQQQNLDLRFPAHRIKRIMRADEEVGKLAQVTPFAIARATELFGTALLNAARVEVLARDSKRVSNVHIKRTIEALPAFDFLKDLVADIPDPAPEASAFPPDYKLDTVIQPLTDQPKRKRGGGERAAGRSSKDEDDDASSSVSPAGTSKQPPKRRGRPRKNDGPAAKKRLSSTGALVDVVDSSVDNDVPSLCQTSSQESILSNSKADVVSTGLSGTSTNQQSCSDIVLPSPSHLPQSSLPHPQPSLSSNIQQPVTIKSDEASLRATSRTPQSDTTLRQCLPAPLPSNFPVSMPALEPTALSSTTPTLDGAQTGITSAANVMRSSINSQGDDYDEDYDNDEDPSDGPTNEDPSTQAESSEIKVDDKGYDASNEMSTDAQPLRSSKSWLEVVMNEKELDNDE